MYGFFHGDLGSPSISNIAYSSDNLDYVLSRNTREFVNSLRGFQNKNNKIYLSKLYQDAIPYFFSDYPNQLTEHLRQHLDDELATELGFPTEYEFMPYETTIADLTAGYGRTVTISPTRTLGGSALSSPALSQFFKDLDKKKFDLNRQGKITRGTVVIEDLPDGYQEQLEEDGVTFNPTKTDD